MLQDVRYALRTLLRKPLISAAAVVTLGLGIGGATAVFSVVYAVLLRPLGFHQPDRLVRVWELTPERDRFSFSDANYLDLRAQSKALQHVAAYRDLGMTAVLSSGGDPERIAVVPVSASLPDVLGVRPQLGRMFNAAEDRAGSAGGQVLLSDSLWRRRFGGRPEIIGEKVTLDGATFVVVGVMPSRFDFPSQTDAWIPLAASAERDRGDKELAVVGRLASGTSVGQVNEELRAIARRLSEVHPESNARWSAEAVPFSEWIIGPAFRRMVWVLFGAVGVLLLLACANVANLLVANAATRRVEMRIRGALGAARARLVRQLFTESSILALLGTGAGVLVAAWAVEGVRAIGGGHVPRLEELRIDATALMFACLAGAASCLLFGLAPALHAARTDLRSGMDEGLRYTSGSRRLRQALVVSEVALALLLVVSAGLLGHSLARLISIDPGFTTQNVVAVPIELPSARDARAPAAFYSDLLARLRALPGITAVGATSTNPFRQAGFSNSVTPEERASDAPPSGLVQAGWRSVTPGFFEAMQIPILRGRAFQDSDRAGAERVIVISDSLARRLWPGSSAVGRRVYWGGTTGRTRTVIGVAGDIRDVKLEAEPPPLVFVPHAQVDLPSMTIIVRTATGITGVLPDIRQVLQKVDSRLPPPLIEAVDASRADATGAPRFHASLLATFASIAVVLAITGVYAMLAFAVAERRREIAVRLALGASRGRIARLILRDGLALAAAGVLCGTVAALAITRVMSNLLYGVAPTDPLTFALAAATLLATATVACYLPARQASRVDPACVLRD